MSTPPNKAQARDQIQDQTQAQQAQLHALFNQSVDPIMMLAPPSWKFTGCNPASLKLFEVPDESTFIQLGPWDLSPEQQPDRMPSSEKASQMIAAAMELGSHFFDWEHKTLSGKKISCTVLLSRVDLQGKSYLQATVRDVTALKISQIEANTIFETMSEGLVIQGAAGEIQKFNPEALKILGLTSDQLLGRTSLDPRWKSIKEDGSAFPAEEHPAMVALRTGKAVRNAVMGLTLPSGEERWIKINAIPFEGYQEKKVAVTFSDITEIVKTNRDMTHIFSHSRDLICIASVDGTFKKVSPGFKTILGYEETELLSRPFAEFIHPDDLEATGKVVQSLSQGIPLSHFENRYRTASGEYRIISWVCESDPRTGLLYATGRDVTELRASEFRNRQVLAALDWAATIVFTDLQGKITEVNKHFCKISGYSREELIGKDHRIVKSGTHSKSFFENLWKTIQSGEVWTGDIRNKNKAGNFYDVRSVIAPIKGVGGQIEQYMAIRFDVTEAKRLESTLSEAQQIAKIGTWKYDLGSGQQTWSSEHYRIFEIDEPQTQEELHRLYRDRIHPDDRAELDRVIERALKFGDDFTYNHRVYLDGGSRIKHVRGIGKVTKDPHGKPIAISGTCQDLTELVALQEQNRFILKSMGIGIWKFNPITQDLQWDQSLYDLYELDPKDFTGHYQAWESSLSPEAKENAVKELEQALSGKKEFDTTFEILTKSGVRKHLGGKSVIIRNEKNEAIMMYGINWNKTKETAIQNALAEQTMLLNSILENLPEMVFVKEYQNGLRFRYLNEAGEKLLGVSSEQILGKNDYDFFPKEQANFFTQNDREVFKAHHVLHIKKEPIQTSSGERWLETYKVPTYKSDGSPDLLIGISKDITEELKVKASLEIERAKSLHSAKLASLGEMSAGIAHEINNPLGIISGLVSLLGKHKYDDEKYSAKLEAISKAAERIERIVKGLKKFARSNEVPEYRWTSLSAIISESLLMTESKAKRHGTPIQTEILSETDILCDEVEIEQVLINLINNAIDAAKESPERWIKIAALIENAEVVLRVMDSGAGVPAAVEEKLFDPFFTTKPVGDGTGLGLSICKGILDQHKASIRLNRAISASCFEIRFAGLREVKRAV